MAYSTVPREERLSAGIQMIAREETRKRYAILPPLRLKRAAGTERAGLDEPRLEGLSRGHDVPCEFISF